MEKNSLPPTLVISVTFHSPF